MKEREGRVPRTPSGRQGAWPPLAPGAVATPGPGAPAVRVGYFGVEGIDDILPQGIAYDTQIMAEGDTGIGKSVLAAPFLYEGVVTGDTCIYIACDEPPSVMRATMAAFRLGTRAHERTGRPIFVDAYARERSRVQYFIPEPENFDEFLLYEKRLIQMAVDRPIRLVVDSLSTIMATADRTDALSFNANRLRYLRSHNVLTLDAFVGKEVICEEIACQHRADEVCEFVVLPLE